LITIREPSGDARPLAIDGHRFVDPATVTIDEEIDTGHLFALPGLADAHAHLTMTDPDDIKGITEDQMRENIPVTAWAHVDRGVLLILDKGGNTDLSLTSLDHDADLRPHVEVAGAMIHPRGGYMPGFGVEVEPEELVDHVRSVASTRGGWVKIVGDWPRKGQGPVDNYPVDRLTEAVDVVHAAGARVAVHTMASSASVAVAAGVDSIEHGPFLTADDVRTLAARGGAWVPTIVNMLNVVDMLGPDSSGGRLFLAGLERMRENLPIAEEAGLAVLAGTDMAVPHGEVSIEAMRLHEYGLSHRAAAAAASSAAYDYVGRDASLAPGSVADVVFFAEDPTEDVEVLGHPVAVIRRGTIVHAP
jgi:imidazolonepropionase-like amidohydrolase